MTTTTYLLNHFKIIKSRHTNKLVVAQLQFNEPLARHSWQTIEVHDTYAGALKKLQQLEKRVAVV